MSGAETAPTGLIWATRGRSWGFRFLLTAGVGDPLAAYERIFAPIGDEPAGWCRAGNAVAVRFPDPLGRRDAAGRVIPHDFVVVGDAAVGVESVEDGLQHVWPLVAEAYTRVWDADGPPSAADLFPG
ncbi:hypothetical protein GCM10023168_14210 [Fodinibacter luteus]|uniref:Uncharacterized protein n=1 Tax=Fodinibacter luteus TaxID=552064 RepID=A0ABP8KAI0_9MICO